MRGANPSGGRRITPAILAEVLGDVADAHGVEPADITGPRKFRWVIHAKQDAMWRLRQRLDAEGRPRHSLKEIARVLGLKDHTAARRGVQRHQARIGGEEAA